MKSNFVKVQICGTKIRIISWREEIDEISLSFSQANQLSDKLRQLGFGSDYDNTE